MDKQNLLSVVVADDEQELLGAVCQLIDWEGIGFKLVGRPARPRQRMKAPPPSRSECSPGPDPYEKAL